MLQLGHNRAVPPEKESAPPEIEKRALGSVAAHGGDCRENAREQGVATLEIEGAKRGWLASVGLDGDGRPVVRAAATPDLERVVASRLQALLEEPFDGRLLGERRGEALLQGLAQVFGRRRPLLGAERAFAYVHGAGHVGAYAPRPPGWDEP